MAAGTHGGGNPSRRAPERACEEVVFVKALGLHDWRASDVMVNGLHDAAEILEMPPWEPSHPDEDPEGGSRPEPARPGGCGPSSLEELLGGWVERSKPKGDAYIILVTDLTDMKMGRVCLAGVDLRTMRDVRPTRGTSGLTLEDLEVAGGPIRPGCVLEFEPPGAGFDPQEPHLEDVPFHRDSAKVLGRIGPRTVNDFLRRIALPSLRDIYGPGMRGRWAMPREVGRSLGTLECSRVSLYKGYKEGWGGGSGRIRIRADIYARSGETMRDLPFNDHLIRDYLQRAKDDGELKERLREVNEELNRGGNPIARMGLTRPFAPYGIREPRCWLQVNAVYPGEA